MSNLILPQTYFTLFTLNATTMMHCSVFTEGTGHYKVLGGRRGGGGGSEGEGEGWELGEKERELFRRRKEGAKSEILKMAGNRINKKKN